MPNENPVDVPVPYDFDNDHGYVKSAAWKRAKAAFGPEHGLVHLMLCLEEEARLRQSCPRQLLADAIFRFIGMSPAEKQEVFFSRCAWWGLEIEHGELKGDGKKPRRRFERGSPPGPKNGRQCPQVTSGNPNQPSGPL